MEKLVSQAPHESLGAAPWGRKLCSAETIAFPCDHPGLRLGHICHRVASDS
jgi:hypothetical protein